MAVSRNVLVWWR